MKLIPILLVSAALTVGFGAGATWALNALGVTDSLVSDVPAATASSSSEKVDGKDVRWWARRARSNGRTARAEAKSLRQLRRALRARVSLSGGTANAAGLTQALLCIGSHEGPWSGPSPTNPTHHGRMQMDASFERTYGAEFVRAWGHAYNWPPYIQIAVAARAVLSGRGFGPWAQTRGLCGL